MSNGSLEQIQNSLNGYFSSGDIPGEGRKIAFWLDPNREWPDQLPHILLPNVKTVTLTEKNSFKIKYTLEIEDKASNYLVYTNLPKSWFRNSHLTDTFLYSKPFVADAIAILADELGIKTEETIDALHKYSSWLLVPGNQRRLASLHCQDYRKETIPLLVMCAIAETNVDLNILLVKVLAEGGMTENRYLEQFAGNNLLEDFWKYYKKWFAWQDDNPTLEKFVIALYISTFRKDINNEKVLPESWKNKFIGPAGIGNTGIFFDHLKAKSEVYANFARFVSQEINLGGILQDIPLNDLVKASIFREIDENIISWILCRLLENDTGAVLSGLSIEEIIQLRLTKEYAGIFKIEYQLLLSAYQFLLIHVEKYPDALSQFVRFYVDELYKPDYYYRRFITLYNSLAAADKYEALQALVENTYTTNCLAASIPAWNKAYIAHYNGYADPEIVKSTGFYKRYIKNTEEKIKTAVIISDAFRYETAVELFNELAKDQNYKVAIDHNLGVFPSYTALGMAALLPHKTLDITPDGSASCDGKPVSDLSKREIVLQSMESDGRCIQYNELIQKTSQERRDVFTGKTIVYIYHNQIDARGETAQTENEVFTACKEGIDEIKKLVKQLSTGANIYRFIITADHGFIYKRNKIPETDKMSILSSAIGMRERRFFIADHEVKDDGIASLSLGKLLNNSNPYYAVFPISANVFKTSGGQNYVHGGSSPQELIIPVIIVKSERYHVDIQKATIKPIGISPIRVNSLMPSFNFLQPDPVSEIIKEETYKICIIDKGEKVISDEQVYTAGSKDGDPNKRMFWKTFTLTNQKYSSKETFYLVIKTGKFELSRTPVIIDIPFADSFGFFDGGIS
jgi:uncharacterized protein (TIGR02687 family)